MEKERKAERLVLGLVVGLVVVETESLGFVVKVGVDEAQEDKVALAHTEGLAVEQ